MVNQSGQSLLSKRESNPRTQTGGSGSGGGSGGSGSSGSTSLTKAQKRKKFGATGDFVVVQTPQGFKRVNISQVDDSGNFIGGSGAVNVSRTKEESLVVKQAPTQDTRRTQSSRQRTSSAFETLAKRPFSKESFNIRTGLEPSQMSVFEPQAQENVAFQRKGILESEPQLRQQSQDLGARSAALGNDIESFNLFQAERESQLEARRKTVDTTKESQVIDFNKEIDLFNKQQEQRTKQLDQKIRGFEQDRRGFEFKSKQFNKVVEERNKAFKPIEEQQKKIESTFFKDVTLVKTDIPNTSGQPTTTKVRKSGIPIITGLQFEREQNKLKSLEQEFNKSFRPVSLSFKSPNIKTIDRSINLTEAQKLRGNLTIDNINKATGIVGKFKADSALKGKESATPLSVSATRRSTESILKGLEKDVQTFEDKQTAKRMGTVAGSAAITVGIGTLAPLAATTKVGKILTSPATSKIATALFVGSEGVNVGFGIKDILEGKKARGIQRIEGTALRGLGFGAGVAALKAPSKVELVGTKAQTTRVQTSKGIGDFTKIEAQLRVKDPFFRRIFNPDKFITVRGTDIQKVTQAGTKFNTKGELDLNLLLKGGTVKVKGKSRGLFKQDGDITKGFELTKVTTTTGKKDQLSKIVSLSQSRGTGKGTSTQLELVKKVGKGGNLFDSLNQQLGVSKSKELISLTKGNTKITKIKTDGVSITNKKAIDKMIKGLGLKITSSKGKTAKSSNGLKLKQTTSTSKSGTTTLNIQKIVSAAKTGIPTGSGKTILFPKLQPINVGKSKLVSDIRSASKSRSFIGSIAGFGAKSISQLSLSSISKVGVAQLPSLRSATSSVSRSELNVEQVLKPFKHSPTTPFVPKLPSIPPLGGRLPPFPPVLPGGGGGGSRRKGGRKIKRFFKFQPSLVAVANSLVGRNNRILTGLEVRRIMRGNEPKRRKK